jgi:hypothetical protein
MENQKKIILFVVVVHKRKTLLRWYAQINFEGDKI